MSPIKSIKKSAADVKQFVTLVKTFNQQKKELPEHIEKLQAFSSDVQTQVDKMNFKNKAHLDRIQEATEHINAELAKYKA